MLNSIEDEYNEYEKNRTWNRVYQEICANAVSAARKNGFSVDVSKKNIRLNRYGDVQPYDHSRVKLQRTNFDYINANIVKCDRANRRYILCQGPLPATVTHFWLMVWEQNSKAILMLNKLIEDRHIKCHLYWPEKIGQKLNLSEVGLTVDYVKCETYSNYCKRTFKITDVDSTKSREVIQFHYTNWPDFGIPTSPIAFLKFLQSVRKAGVLEENVGPAVVHCSAGIGRSGTFCLVDCCLIIIDKFGENNVSVKEVLMELRKYRMGLIQTPDQLYFSYKAILEGMKFLKENRFQSLEDDPLISNEDRMFTEPDEPPVIPQRTQSLHLQHSGLISYDNNTSSKLNNNDASQNAPASHAENHLANRPLPELPTNSSSDSDDSSSSGEEEIIRSINTSEEENDDDLLRDASEMDVAEIEKDPETSREVNGNGNDDENTTSPNNSTEVRRRKRLENNKNMEEKIRDIKRKQKEMEDSVLTSKKRRENIRSE
ncbi:tyrosine-protein phosphatase non-receptor type 61F isoform X2 [Culicoides brevitarsis]|uniref:tyrosine-protein phosphatase non-receptor type 61F isoform X2 n=1 Tax=Culicoides brevitarsis TaxID=469753 RepID=UPI00307C9D5C